ncbi:hypothetical protein MKW92_043891 [Papaver armeniacum]|nr:hypothetical protein MKW92_043891 [Papaver armeniacum]
MVTFESEDDTMFSDSTSVESFNIDEIEFSTSFEEGGVIESYLLCSCIVHVDHFGPISNNTLDTSHLWSIGKKRKKDTGTKKINCPFKLSVLCGDDSKWRVTVRNGRHSHDPPESLVGHVTSSLSQEEYQRVVHLYGDEFPGMVCHIKTIYNVILKSKRISGDGRTSVQEFKHLCAENHYIFRSRTNINKEITDLFFAHPKFTSLANTFHNFVILENTYKTNLYDMSLLNLVSHTSTKAPFTVALCFMQFEREDNFVWEFERLKEIYLYDNVPTLFLTDCSQAMIKAVKRVFPFSTHLLCTWHINKDMMAYCKPIINPLRRRRTRTRVMSKMSKMR